MIQQSNKEDLKQSTNKASQKRIVFSINERISTCHHYIETKTRYLLQQTYFQMKMKDSIIQVLRSTHFLMA